MLCCTRHDKERSLENRRTVTGVATAGAVRQPEAVEEMWAGTLLIDTDDEV